MEKIDLSIEYFFSNAIKYNKIHIRDKYQDYIKVSYDKALVYFQNFKREYNTKLHIYKDIEYQYNFSNISFFYHPPIKVGFKYHIVDDTGLCLGYLIGPFDMPDNDVLSIDQDHYSKFTITYSLFNSFDKNKCDYAENLSMFRKKFIPLIRFNETNNKNYFFHYKSSDHYEIIYRLGNTSIYLPIELLLIKCNKLSLPDYEINAELKREFIEFELREYEKFYRYTDWMVSKGKISYDNFEIFDFALENEWKD